MENEPIREEFDRAVVEPIENGFLATFRTDEDERVSYFRSFQRALKYLKTAYDETKGEQQ